jgi:hypothetical protein
MFLFLIYRFTAFLPFYRYRYLKKKAATTLWSMEISHSLEPRSMIFFKSLCDFICTSKVGYGQKIEIQNQCPFKFLIFLTFSTLNLDRASAERVFSRLRRVKLMKSSILVIPLVKMERHWIISSYSFMMPIMVC